MLTDINCFFDQIKQSQTNKLKLSPHIFYHSDTDGLCSAALMFAYLTKELSIQDVKLQCLSIDEIQSVVVFSPSIFVDLPVLPQKIENPQKQPILIIDHHMISDKIIRDNNVFYINPRENDPEVYKPASFVVFSLFEQYEAIKKRAFIAAVGIIGDRGDKNDEGCKNFVEKFDKDSVLKLSEVITGVVEINKKNFNFNAISSGLIKFLLEQNSAEDFLTKPSEYLEQADEFQKNLKKAICLSKIEKLNDVVLFVQIDSKFCSSSIISNLMADKYSDNTIFVVSKSQFKNQRIKISCRSKLLDCNHLMRQIASQIPDSNGGGHERAAGLIIPVKYFQKFINFVKNMPPT